MIALISQNNMHTCDPANFEGWGKYVLVFSILRDTGMRPIELERTRVRDIDLERGTITVRTAKGGVGRMVQVKKQTLALLKAYLGKRSFGLNDRQFPKRRKMTGRWVRLRNTVAAKLMDPSFKTIRLYDLRYFAATMTYHKTRDILYTQKMLGHRKFQEHSEVRATGKLRGGRLHICSCRDR